jgi:dual specificity tyrosine-phosphorylation-regulated kinase 2/3/4
MAIRLHGRHLTAFEQSEILQYGEVFFTGGEAAKKVQGIPHTACNNGYDDERGDYRLVMHDHIDYRYEVLANLGKGSFGQVVKVMDHKTRHVYALKLIRNKKRFHHQALIEVKILEHIVREDPENRSNIIHIRSSFYFRNHLCILFDMLHINLYEFIKQNNFKGCTLGLIRKFAVSLLHALDFLRQQRIVHCDLKPENVLLRAPNRSAVQLIDFGSSCYEKESIYTYIQSRFYRAPEVILGMSYGHPIDMWSFGCILSELYTGYPLFPGEDETEQIQCILEVLGAPPRAWVDAASRKAKFFDESGEPRVVPNSRGKTRRAGAKTLAAATGCPDALFVNFLQQCLRW